MYAIAIDGPSASGKGVVSDKLSEKLGILHLNSGALYRAVGYFALKNNLSIDDGDKILEKIKNHKVSVRYEDGKQITLLDGVNINDKLYTADTTRASAHVSKHIGLREFVLSTQLDIAKHNSLVLEGRDITSVVLPNAKYKFFLDASLEVRAKRRYADFMARGENLTLEEVTKSLEERDYIDKTRTVSPLIRVKDAVYIDSSNMTIDEVVDKMLSYIKEK